jgi:hypothetical protein
VVASAAAVVGAAVGSAAAAVGAVVGSAAAVVGAAGAVVGAAACWPPQAARTGRSRAASRATRNDFRMGIFLLTQ